MTKLHQMAFYCIKISDDCFKVIEFTHPAPKHCATFHSYEAVLEQLTPFSIEPLDDDGMITLMHCAYLQPVAATPL